VRGFSLLELLFALALVAGLAALGFEAYGVFSQSAALTTGADAVSDLLAEGRDDAITQNITVEVRIYADASGAYRVAQLHWLKSDGTRPALRPALFLPSSVVFDATAAHSSLIAANPDTVAPDASDPRVNGLTRAFHFLSDGSTDLDPAGKWFLTLRAVMQSDPTHFPGNWACLMIDPATGRVSILRP
jgi:uncharacterized protein (TIGR02596 family)